MGVLAAIASNIATTETNIEHVAVDERDGDASTLVFDLQVRDRKHLAHVIKNLRQDARSAARHAHARLAYCSVLHLVIA